MLLMIPVLSIAHLPVYNTQRTQGSINAQVGDATNDLSDLCLAPGCYTSCEEKKDMSGPSMEFT
jgi:hypothetical protein